MENSTKLQYLSKVDVFRDLTEVEVKEIGQLAVAATCGWRIPEITRR